MVRELLDAALKYEVKGKFLEAARLYQDAKRFDKASFMYHKAGMHDESVEMLVQGGQISKAAEYCQKLEKFGRAAELYEQAGDHLKAAQAYLESFQYERAAMMYEKLGRLEDAAGLYLKMENYLKAGQLYEKSGDRENSMYAYKRLVESGDLDKLKSAGKLDSLADIFLKAGDTRKAVALYLKAGRTETAVVESIKAGLFKEAVDIYRAHSTDIGYQLLSAIPKDNSTVYVNFARFFENLGDHHMAGQIFENNSDFEAAGRAYKASGDAEISAECFFRAENYKSAAEMYEASSQYKTAGDLFYKLKDYPSAARNYENDGLFYRSGRLYQLIGQNEKAIGLLQKVQSHDPDYSKAVRIIANAFTESGYTDLALEKYTEIIPSTALDGESIDLFYDYAITLASGGDFSEAAAVLKKIIGFQFGYKDAAQKLKEFQAMTAEKPSGKAPAKQPKPVSVPVSVAQPNGEPPDLLAEIKQAGPAVPEIKAPLPKAETRPVQAPDKAVKLLQNFPVFDGFTPDDLSLIWNLGETSVFQNNEIIFNEGDKNNSFFILATGKIALINKNGLELYKSSTPGEHFGELSLINSPPSRYGVKCLSKVRALKFESRAFLDFIRKNKKLSLLFYRSFSDSLSLRLQELSPAAVSIKNDIEDLIKILPAVMV